MDSWKEWLLAALVCSLCALIGMGKGAASAAADIALRCERLGNFMVESETFDCSPKGKK